MHESSAPQAADFKTPRRRCIHPINNDTWESIAQREMPDSPLNDAIAQLQSWNLHVFARRVIDDSTGEMGNPILPSDLLFLEPPLVREA
tara:strand:- start:155 stop:421 length:267 start_codon:yes stop_codon:yes gene_type:complete